MKSVSHFSHQDIEAFKFGYAPIGKPKMQVHIYFVDGLLIDTGQRKMSKEILRTISHLPVEKIFVTHHHEDHTGNLALLVNHFKCPAFSSPACAEIMKNPQPISNAQKAVWGNRPSFDTLTPICDSLETPNHIFHLIPIPGHAKDMVALYEPDRRWLFSADLYVNSKITYYLKGENMKQQIASTSKILDLDFDAMFCAHRPQLTGGKERLERKLGFMLSYYEKVSRLHRDGNSPKEIMKILNLKENWPIKLFSGGDLSQLNMVKAVTDYC